MKYVLGWSAFFVGALVLTARLATDFWNGVWIFGLLFIAPGISVLIMSNRKRRER